jgi:hypothetical protein
LEQNEPFSTLKTMIFRKYIIQKLTQFLQGNNVLHDPASNTDGYLWREKCVFSTQMNRPIWNKMSQHHLENCDFQEVFLQKINQFSHGNKVLDDPASKTMIFF